MGDDDYMVLLPSGVRLIGREIHNRFLSRVEKKDAGFNSGFNLVCQMSVQAGGQRTYSDGRINIQYFPAKKSFNIIPKISSDVGYVEAIFRKFIS